MKARLLALAIVIANLLIFLIPAQIPSGAPTSAV